MILDGREFSKRTKSHKEKTFPQYSHVSFLFFRAEAVIRLKEGAKSWDTEKEDVMEGWVEESEEKEKVEDTVYLDREEKEEKDDCGREISPDRWLVKFNG